MVWSAATEPWRFPGPWISWDPCADPRKTAGWCCTRSPGRTRKIPDRPGAASITRLSITRVSRPISPSATCLSISKMAHEPAAQPAFRAAFDVVKSLGVRLKEIQLPDFPYGALVGTIIAGEAGSIFEDFIRSGKVDQLADPHQIAGLKAMLDLPVHRVFARHARAVAGQGGLPRSVPGLRHGAGAYAPGAGKQGRPSRWMRRVRRPGRAAV